MPAALRRVARLPLRKTLPGEYVRARTQSRGAVRLWALDIGHHQFGRVHSFRVQFLEAQVAARLAVVQWLQCVHAALDSGLWSTV